MTTTREPLDLEDDGRDGDPMFQDYCDAMDGLQEVYRKESEIQKRRVNRINKILVALFPKRRITALKDYFSDIGANHFSITKTTERGKKQKCEVPGIKWEWVYQYINGGYEGDSYAGYIYLQLKGNPERYLKVHYEC